MDFLPPPSKTTYTIYTMPTHPLLLQISRRSSPPLTPLARLSAANFLILLITYISLHHLTPSYLTDLLCFQPPTHILCSADAHLLTPITKSKCHTLGTYHSPSPHQLSGTPCPFTSRQPTHSLHSKVNSKLTTSEQPLKTDCLIYPYVFRFFNWLPLLYHLFCVTSLYSFCLFLFTVHLSPCCFCNTSLNT